MLQKILVIFSTTKEWLLEYLNKLEIGESLTLFAHLHSFLSVQVIFINIYWHGYKREVLIIMKASIAKLSHNNQWRWL